MKNNYAKDYQLANDLAKQAKAEEKRGHNKKQFSNALTHSHVLPEYCNGLTTVFDRNGS